MKKSSAISLTNDGVYDVEIANFEMYDASKFQFSYYKTYIYEKGDELIVENRGVVDSMYDSEKEIQGYRFRTPKQPVYDALEALKSAPYVCIDDTILGFEVAPVTESDRTLVPMRFLFEQLGAEVEWNAETETATATNDEAVIEFSIDNTTATVNGKKVVMDVPARLIDSKTMVPLRFLSENLGYTVEWDEDTRMATVITK